MLAGLKGAIYDRLSATGERAGFRETRRELLAGAGGRVLEVGAGTGLNVELYPDEVEELVLVEPDEGMAHRLRRRVSESGRPATVVSAAAESLPFEDASFDTVVATLVLCSVEDLDRSLAELRRVLKPGGQLLFAEHVLSDDPKLARWQDRLDRPWWGLISMGCHCNRRTLEAIEEAPFQVNEVERGSLPKAPPIVRPLVVGRAVPR